MTRRQREIDGLGTLQAYLDSGQSLHGVRLQDLDLRAVTPTLLARDDLAGLVVLGGRMPKRLVHHLVQHGASIFPADGEAPVNPYRAQLYTADDLYADLAEGYQRTPDARAFRWYLRTVRTHDVYDTLLQAIHDDAISDRLTEVLQDRSVVGVMGGHALTRDSFRYAAAARLGHTLAEAGHLVLTGGGPGAMEAANLGAFARDATSLEAALEILAAVPSFHDSIDAWAVSGFAARARLQAADGDRLTAGGRRVAARPEDADSPDLELPIDHDLRSLGLPTWFYGHEPPNVFGERIAKYFSNALREEGIVARSSAGVLVLPGAAGTVQEIAAACTPMFYAAHPADIRPLVLVGVEHWTEVLPVWPLLRALAAGRAMADSLFLVDSVQEAAAVISPALR